MSLVMTMNNNNSSSTISLNDQCNNNRLCLTHVSRCGGSDISLQFSIVVCVVVSSPATASTLAAVLVCFVVLPVLLFLLFPYFRRLYYPVGMLQHFIIMITVAAQIRILQQMRRRLMDFRFHTIMVTEVIETCLKTNGSIDRKKIEQRHNN